MSISGISPAQLREIQAQWNSHQTGQYYESSSAETPDGSRKLTVGSSGGGCMEPTTHTIHAYDAHGGEVYSHSNKGGDAYSAPAISPNGNTGFVIASHLARGGEWKYNVMRVPIRTGWFNSPSKVVSTDYARALAVSPDGETLALGVDKEVRTVDADLGFVGRLFGKRPVTAASLPDEVDELKYLSDGSLLVYTRSWERACWVVTGGKSGAVRVPLAVLSPEKHLDKIQGQLPWLESGKLQSFLSQAPWMADDEGVAMPNAAARSPRGKTTAVVVGDGSASQKLWTWNGTTMQEVGTMPVSEKVGYESKVSWSADGVLVYVAHNDEAGTTIANPTGGKFTTVPGLTASSFKGDTGKRVFAIATPQGGPALWSWDRQGNAAPMHSLASSRPDGDVSMQWTKDEQRVVTWFRPQGAERMAVHIAGLDGSYFAIPAADEVKFRRDVLTIKLFGDTHVIKVPADLATLEQQDWYQKACGNTLLGGKAPPKPDLKIEREEDHIDIGGVSVPIRKKEPDVAAGAASTGASA